MVQNAVALVHACPISNATAATSGGHSAAGLQPPSRACVYPKATSAVPCPPSRLVAAPAAGQRADVPRYVPVWVYRAFHVGRREPAAPVRTQISVPTTWTPNTS